MSGSSPIKLHRAATVFSKFCSDMEFLPSYTPIFLIDSCGRIVNKRRLLTSKDAFESVYNIADREDIPFMLEQSCLRDAYAVKGKLDDGKNFIVVSKDTDGFSRCVVCSYSEDKCIRLDDYIEKLCSYKDYLDSFASLAFSSVARLPAKRIFRMKISGALELVELASGAYNDSERRISFPVALALEKLGRFAAKSNGGTFTLENTEECAKAVVNTPESFFKLAVSAMALVLRHSKNKEVSAFVNRLLPEGAVRITLSARSRGVQNDIYERALISALNERGFACGVRDDGEEYSLFIDAELEKYVKPVLSDVEIISKRIDTIMDEQVLEDIYFTISDI